MDIDDMLLKELQAQKTQFLSSTDPDEKAAAFRKQSIILEQISKCSSEAEKISILRSQFKEYNLNNANFYNAYIEERSKKVEMILSSLPHSTSNSCLSAEEFLKENKLRLEPECSGKYESCQTEEVSEIDLKMFQRITPEIPSPKLIESPPAKQQKMDNVLNIENENAPKLNINSFFSNNSSARNELKGGCYRTAREELIIQNMKKNGDTGSSSSSRTLFNYGALKRSLGARRNVRSGFVPPIRQEDNNSPTCTASNAMDSSPSESIDERLRNIDPKMIELISNEIMHKDKPISWEDIAGLEYAKSTIKEAVVWPMLRPDIFTGLRRPARGILLFGPPGTGKTLIGKCIASQSKSTFFSISASSLTSKWVGDGEKMVRALFAVAAVHQPSVVFIDEIDSLLSQRSCTEHESSRRLKTEFLVQLDGANTMDDERILIVGATNRPQELDEAARRRLVRRLYIPLPELSARIQILTNLLQTVRNSITSEEILEIGNLTNGYSGADMETLCREASMEPIRSIPIDEIPFISEKNVAPVCLEDFRSALRTIRASVSQSDLQQYADWNRTYGAGQ